MFDKVRQCLLSRQEQSFVSVYFFFGHIQIVQKVIKYSSSEHTIGTNDRFGKKGLGKNKESV